MGTRSTSTASTSLPSSSATEPPTATTTDSSGSILCKGNPSRWTTDEQCAQCASGYKWWPCNEVELCFCAGALSQLRADVPKRRRMKAQKFLASESMLVQVAKTASDVHSEAEGAL